MKLSKGKNWFQIDFDKKSHKGLYVGPLFAEEKDVDHHYEYKLISFMTRRFKLRLLKNRKEKKWELSFGGLWTSEGTKDQYINYTISTSQFKDIS